METLVEARPPPPEKKRYEIQNVYVYINDQQVAIAVW